MLATALTDDPQALKALIGELVGQLDAKHQAITSLEQRIADLQLQIAVLRRARFGRRSERLDPSAFYPKHRTNRSRPSRAGHQVQGVHLLTASMTNARRRSRSA
jgi:hypothetical protein